MLERLDEASGGLVRLITLAPELDGAVDFIRQASRICRVSLGHSAADYESAVEAYGAGASHTTHLFNAMPSLHHRRPGLIAAAYDCGATAELICDGFHVHPAMIRLAWQIFKERIVLISDSLRCAGMPDGEYSLGGQPVSMKNGKATLRGTDTLAGSSIHLMEGLRRAVSFGIPLTDAVRAATEVPARVTGIDHETGSIKAGRAADLLLLDEQLKVLAVYVDGEKVR
jgi:N-acetylglucosamine-6-phosphate deacetylase